MMLQNDVTALTTRWQAEQTALFLIINLCGKFTVSDCVSDCDGDLRYAKMDTMYFNEPIHS